MKTILNEGHGSSANNFMSRKGDKLGSRGGTNLARKHNS